MSRPYAASTFPVFRLDDFLPKLTHFFPTNENKKEESRRRERKQKEKKTQSIWRKREACAGSGTALPEGRTSNLGHNRVPLLVSGQICRHASSSQTSSSRTCPEYRCLLMEKEQASQTFVQFRSGLHFWEVYPTTRFFDKFCRSRNLIEYYIVTAIPSTILFVR